MLNMVPNYDYNIITKCKQNNMYVIYLINKYLFVMLVSNFYINSQTNYLNYVFNMFNCTNLVSSNEVIKFSSFLPRSLSSSIEIIQAKSSSKKELYHLTIKAVYFNMSVGHESAKVDQGFYKMALMSNTKGLGVKSLRKFIKAYTMAVNLLYNLFSYAIPFLVFSNPIMRLEAISVSWGCGTKIKNMWRHINSSLLNNRNSVSLTHRNTFQLIAFLGINTAVVTDTLYHDKTVAQIRRCRIYAVGLVPITLYSTNVDLVIPIGGATMLNQYIFFRLVAIIKRAATADNFMKLKSTWANL